MSERLHYPERHAKALGVILLQEKERDEFNSLTDAQKGYFLHWCRSNWRDDNAWSRGMRKAKAQR
jgi:hypothetical protein